MLGRKDGRKLLLKDYIIAVKESYCNIQVTWW